MNMYVHHMQKGMSTANEQDNSSSVDHRADMQA